MRTHWYSSADKQNKGRSGQRSQCLRPSSATRNHWFPGLSGSPCQSWRGAHAGTGVAQQNTTVMMLRKYPPPTPKTRTKTAPSHTKTVCVRFGGGEGPERGHCLLSGLPQHRTACLTSNKATGKGAAAAPVSRATGVSKKWKRAAVWRLQGPGWHTWLASWPGGLGTLARHWHAALCRWLPSPPF